MCIYSCFLIGQGAKDEMIAELTIIVTGIVTYISTLCVYPQITINIFVHLHVVIDMMR